MTQANKDQLKILKALITIAYKKTFAYGAMIVSCLFLVAFSHNELANLVAMVIFAISFCGFFLNMFRLNHIQSDLTNSLFKPL